MGDQVMQRKVDWYDRLSDHIRSLTQTPYDEATHNCAHFAGDAVKAMTGVDPLGTLRDCTSLEEMVDAIEAAGYSDAADYVSSMLPEIPVHEAGPGDVVMMPGEGDGFSFGIVQQEYCYALARSGLLMVPKRFAKKAFKV